MRDSKILITGPTGQVATPITLSLAAGNEVWGAARFKDAGARATLEAAGVQCVPIDLAAGDFSNLPSDFDYVLNLAVAKSGRWDKDMAVNAESVGLLMQHCRSAKAFLHCSSTAVYDPPDREPRAENAALGDNHKNLFPTYSISKIAGEAVVRTMARALGLPTTIARLNVPYGDNGGWPFWQMETILAGQPVAVPPGGPAEYNPIHADDLIAQLPGLLEAAAVPATVVNWAGAERVSIQEWCGYLASLVGQPVEFVEDPSALAGVPCDVTRLHALVAPAQVSWKDGMRRLVQATHPELHVD
jgi:UDP-glucuronate 4-epimerase